MSESVISTMGGSGFLRLRMLGRRGGHDEAWDLDESDEDGAAEAFDGLDERTRGEAFLLAGLGFSISVVCSVGVTDSSDTCDAPVFSALAASFLGVFLAVLAVLAVLGVLAGAGGSSLKTHLPSSPILRVYQSGVRSTPSSSAIVRNFL